MSPRLNKSVTLIELLIAITLLSVIVIGFSSIEIFSRYHVLTADRRAQVQNEASYVLEHMSKNISRAIGNERVNSPNSVVDIREPTGDNEQRRIKIYIDANGNGIRDDPTYNPVANQDHWIAYRYYDNTDAASTRRNSIQFCNLCRSKSCGQCTAGWETVSVKANRFSGLVLFKPGDDRLSDNFLEVEVSACWDPDGDPVDCGLPDNPGVNMQTRIKMPSVSIN